MTEATTNRLDRLFKPFQQFIRAESLGGVILLVCTAIALAWVNSPVGDSYVHLWETELAIGPFSASLHACINDGLMAVFFLLVGLEIKRELLVGELSTRQQAALPVVAAFGGMVVPALIYALVNAGEPGIHGWGVPMATDIAFALGVLSLLGDRVPAGLKVFLAALAIADDMGAVLVIALFYTAQLDVFWLGAAGLTFIALVACNAANVQRLLPYLLIGAVLWWAVLQSGVHATIAGVLLALTIPARTRGGAGPASRQAPATTTGATPHQREGDSADRLPVDGLNGASQGVQGPLLKLEHALQGVVAYLIVPLFAVANAGVRFDAVHAAGGGSAVIWGAALGLLIGKPIGITLFSWLSVRTGQAVLPSGATWRAMLGVACLGGIGFTMSLFVAGLAFGEGALLSAGKVGVLGASALSGVVGLTVLRRALASEAAGPMPPRDAP